MLERIKAGEKKKIIDSRAMNNFPTAIK